ncbi:MAG: DegT/DnrJ/EryC1/StrS family aminotransferase, partial [Planctomycetota bacterium]
HIAAKPIKVLDLPAEYASRKDEYDAAMAGVLASGSFVLGPEVKALEAELAAYVGVKHAVTCGNGTDALRLSLQALGVGCGDEVIIPAFTFFASCEAVIHVGATPVFADVVSETFLLDPVSAASRVTVKTKAVMPVSLFGQVADVSAIRQAVCHTAGRDVAVLEDSAQSFGAIRGGAKSGAVGSVSATSFFPTKPLGSFGDGGCCFTSDAELAEQIMRLRHHGDAGRYDHQTIGWNSRLDAMQAAILRVKLCHLDEDLAGRRRVAQAYDIGLKGLPHLTRPKIDVDSQSVFAQYALRIDAAAVGGGGRNAVQAALVQLGVPTSVHYPKAVYEQPGVKALNLSDVRPCSEAERAAAEVLCLPIYPHMPERDIQRVIHAIREVLRPGRSSVVVRAGVRLTSKASRQSEVA